MKIPVLLILVLACCNATRAQDQTKPAVRTQTPIQSPASTQAQPQTHPAQQAQQHHPAPPPHRWSLDLSAGPGFPAGRFAQTDEGDPRSGPVHTGSLVELGGTYHLNRSWGITLLANHQHHSSEVEEFIVPDPPAPELSVPGPLNADPGMGYTPIGTQHWSMTRILAGGVYTMPLNRTKSLSLLLRALAGIQKTHVSQYEYSLNEQNVTAVSDYPARNLAWAFSYQADAGLQYKVYRRWSLLAFAGYNGCRAPYRQDITQLVYYNGVYSSPVYKRIHFPTGSILVRAGLGFDL